MPNDSTVKHDPSPILQAAFGFWSSKVLLTAVEFGLFTKLGARRLRGADLGRELGLHPRGISDFFDALVAMKFLDRQGNGPDARATAPQRFVSLMALAKVPHHSRKTLQFSVFTVESHRNGIGPGRARWNSRLLWPIIVLSVCPLPNVERIASRETGQSATCA